MDIRRPSRSIQVGDAFTRWRVIEILSSNGHGTKRKILCECARDLGGCGTTRNVNAPHLVRGASRSCGCLQKDNPTNVTHGKTGTPEHVSWSAMKTRCTNPRQKSWADYGGRGIYVCPRWWQSFSCFFDDMGPMPSSKMSIDRKDTDGSYTCGKCDDCIAKGAPMNCRWATTDEQANNMTRNRVLTYNGESMNIVAWTRRLGYSPSVIFGRLQRGWTVEQALGTPLLGHGLKRKFEEQKGSMARAAPDHHTSLAKTQRNPNPRKAWKHIPTPG